MTTTTLKNPNSLSNIQALLVQAQQASASIRNLTDGQKQEVLKYLAQLLQSHQQEIQTANQKDLVRMDDDNPKKDRLLLTPERIEGLAQSLHDVAALPDPSNHILYEKTLPNGLHIQKKSVPMGVVGIIYEARPNVTIDVAALCIRSGNACVLRGGSDALYSNQYLVQLIHQALTKFGVAQQAVTLLPVDRKFVQELLTAERYVDIIIPRGSQQLIDFVRKNATVPTIETGAGVCHTYVTETANLTHARAIVVNAKTSRPSVCNALDTIIVDQTIANDFLPTILEGFLPFQVAIFADETAYKILAPTNYPHLHQATEADFGREFLDYKCSVKVVQSADEAFQHIQRYSSRHSEAIISEDPTLCERFLNAVDAAAVYTNASTRFTDGGVFGLGAEIGISTQKLHARGPFALEKLTTEKWVVRGNGQVR